MITFVLVGITFGVGIFAAGAWLGYRWAVEEARYRELTSDLRPGGGPL